MQGNQLALDAVKTEGLPFDADRQRALYGYVVSEDKFFLQVKDRIEGKWFVESAVGKLYTAYGNFFKRYLRVPQSTQEFFSFDEIVVMDPSERIKMKNVHMAALNNRVLFGKDVLAQELTDWMRCRIYHASVSESARLFNSKQINSAVQILESAVKEFQTTRFDGVASADFSMASALVEQQQIDMNRALTTGLPLLDKKILPEALGLGSLLPGDTTVLIAPVNIGKTTTMINIARHNIAAGKDVLLISLEGRQLDIMEKIYCASLKVNKAEFRRLAMSKDEQDKLRINYIQDALTDRLVYLSMNKPGLTVEEVVSVVRMHQARRMALTGKGFDLLVVDYPQILTTEEAKHGNLVGREIQDRVYRQFVQLALEEKFHALLAAQTNREGSKINRHTADETRLLIFEDVAEAFAICMSATNIITLNRSPSDMTANRMTFYVCKSRSSDVGWAVVCRTDFSRSLSHSVELGATAYRGSDTMADRIENLLQTHLNGDIPLSAFS